jgi:hypothetical protein
MDPISERGEPKISAEEVKEKIEAHYGVYDSEAEVSRVEEHEEVRRDEIDASNLDEDAQRDIRCLTEAILFESLHEPEKGQIAVANVIMNRATFNERRDGEPNARHRIEFQGGVCGVVAFKVSKSFTQRRGHGRHAKMIHRTVTTCAFSYRCERGFHAKLERFEQREEWNEIKTLATEAYLRYNSGENEDPSGGALFYHASYCHPWWRKIYHKTTQIGAHIFYRIPNN